ncbi:NUDIX hydrolase [Zhihengliuella flava]|uniref:8-oxo-dGTP pyrophosphatase MutT (NUDIX family) n=1 Tax=Zhihengliuella flava TaxID=1285193 RepID=A0A931DCW4_9MICC|nr:NUDIX hydrolase [Zhihengliuella flava]MBG6084533.1 8-oxo-dGTP pyrophosphatase MutT (NUDIX family) [Zhihengliuella flava]
MTNPPTEFAGNAAVAVLVRDGAAGVEVLLLERLMRGSFAGAWVFPGGYVDPEDAGTPAEYDAAAWATDVPVAEVPRALVAATRRAAVRETEEETGLRIDAASLLPMTCWVPPADSPKRMRAWYYLAPLEGEGGAGQEDAIQPGGARSSDQVRLSDGEHSAWEWLTPADALARHGAGEKRLVPPIWATLNWLAEAGDTVEQVTAAARGALASRAAGESAAHGGGGVVLDDPDAGTAFVEYRSQLLSEGERKFVLWHGDAQWRDDLAEAGHAPHPLHPVRQAGEQAAGAHRLDITGLPWTLTRR